MNEIRIEITITQDMIDAGGWKLQVPEMSIDRWGKPEKLPAKYLGSFFLSKKGSQVGDVISFPIVSVPDYKT